MNGTVACRYSRVSSVKRPYWRGEATVGIQSRACYCTHNFHPDASPVNMAAGFEELSAMSQLC